MNTPSYHRMGTHAILVESQHSEASLLTQRVYWTLDGLCAGMAGLVEAVPGMNNLLLIFSAVCVREGALKLLPDLWLQACEYSDSYEQKTHLIGVHYGGEEGQDLCEVARHANLSIDALVKAHSSAEYTVFCLGAHPGFAYLGGLPLTLHTPRRRIPRQRANAGSVAIGGSQTGVTAATLPSGWNLIGTTTTEFFNHRSDPPALLAPGDKVKFEILGIVA